MFCCITQLGWAADTPNYFAVWLNNGQRIDLLLSEKPTATFSEGIINFEAPGTSIQYKAAEVKEFTLEAMPVTGIESFSVEDKLYAVNQSGNVLSISGAKPNAKLQLYNSGGMLISTHPVDSKGCVNIPLNALIRGGYILKIDSTTIKIMRK